MKNSIKFVLFAVLLGSALGGCGVEYITKYRSSERSILETGWAIMPFEVVNFMELVGESMGLERPDLFKRLKIMQDVDAIIAESHDMIDAQGLDLDEVRAVILQDMLGDQPLPLGRR